MSIKLISSFVIVLCWTCCPCLAQTNLGCLNEFGHPVDWFVLYKIPKLKSAPKPFNSGRAYVFFTSDHGSNDKWQLSPNLIHQDNSILGVTLNQVYQNEDKYTYIQYNDEPPVKVKRSTESAHAKGIIALNETTGFWLIHSMPLFPPPFKSSYSVPNSALTYGQTAICISIHTTSQADFILEQLLISRPIVYASGQSEQVSVFNWDAVVSGHWSDVERDTISFESIDGNRFMDFSKSPLAKFEFYSDQVAPLLSTDLLVETWRNGAGIKLNSTCNTQFKVNDVQNVSLHFDLAPEIIKSQTVNESISGSNSIFKKISTQVSKVLRHRFRRPAYDQLTVKSVNWEYHEDHSKWAISANPSLPFVCIGDLNRMQSQSKRGGGSVCHRNPILWKLFFDTILDVNHCPVADAKPSPTTTLLVPNLNLIQNKTITM